MLQPYGGDASPTRLALADTSFSSNGQAGRRGTQVRTAFYVCYPPNLCTLQKLAHQFQRSMLVSLRLDENLKDFAFGVDCAPEIDHPAADFQIDVQVPSLPPPPFPWR